MAGRGISHGQIPIQDAEHSGYQTEDGGDALQYVNGRIMILMYQLTVQHNMSVQDTPRAGKQIPSAGGGRESQLRGKRVPSGGDVCGEIERNGGERDKPWPDSDTGCPSSCCLAWRS